MQVIHHSDRWQKNHFSAMSVEGGGKGGQQACVYDSKFISVLWSILYCSAISFLLIFSHPCNMPSVVVGYESPLIPAYAGMTKLKAGFVTRYESRDLAETS